MRSLRIYCILITAVSALTTFSQPLPPILAGEKAPRPVLHLLKWPTETSIEKRIPATSKSVTAAVHSSERWLRWVVDTSRLPTKPEATCTGGEFEGRDVVRIRWKSGSYNLMAAQTSSIFVLEIQPEPNPLIAASRLPERLKAVREVCGQVFTKTGVRRTGQGDLIDTPGFGEKLLEFSFSEQTTTVSNDGVVLIGRPKTMAEAGVAEPRTTQDLKEEAEKWANTDWDKSAAGWVYWLRNLYWFADDERVVVYFLKAEGGPHPLLFSGASDNKWFLKEPSQ